MYVPFQEVFTAGLVGVGVFKNKKGEVISDGKILDYCEHMDKKKQRWSNLPILMHARYSLLGPKKCVDEDLNQHCTRPILVHKSTCYTVRHCCLIGGIEGSPGYSHLLTGCIHFNQIEWSTEGALSHTTAEFRDAKSNEVRRTDLHQVPSRWRRI